MKQRSRRDFLQSVSAAATALGLGKARALKETVLGAHTNVEQARGTTLTEFSTKRLPAAPDDVAPDGSDVRVLLGLDGGGMAHFELGPGETSTAISHRTIDEVWFFLSGRGEMWRKQGQREEVVLVDPGVCITLPVGTHFQFRSFGYEPLAAIGVTMPPWPGEGEAYEVEGKWKATVPRKP